VQKCIRIGIHGSTRYIHWKDREGLLLVRSQLTYSQEMLSMWHPISYMAMKIQETACGNSSASFQNEISFYGSALANLISFQAVPQCVEVTGFLQVASL